MFDFRVLMVGTAGFEPATPTPPVWLLLNDFKRLTPFEVATLPERFQRLSSLVANLQGPLDRTQKAIEEARA